MKRTFSLIMWAILFFGFSLNIGAQGAEPDISGQSNNIYIVNSPGSWDDGFSQGFGYEYQNRTFYVGPEIYYFPGLANRENNPNAQGYDYFHFMGRFGFNKEFGEPMKSKHRFYVGTRLGLIYRETGGMNYANLGGEIGYQWTLPFGLFFRIAGTIDEATDSKVYSNDDSITRRSVYTSVGIRF